MKILITGVAGFIGAALAHRLLNLGHTVYGVDNLNAYYAISLKQARLAELTKNNFNFFAYDITDLASINVLFNNNFDVVIHLAAQAGVRHSISHPQDYFNTNLLGFGHILEACRRQQIKHLIYASSSSVYGANRKQPSCETDCTASPMSLYAASKIANEVMAYSYAHLYNLPCTGLRFFTVYGPWMRPDMALFKFAQLITHNQPIPVYNYGRMLRNFTYIDDIINGILLVITNPISAPHRIYNLGGGQKVELLYLIELLEQNLGLQAELNLLPAQAGDPLANVADTSLFAQDFNFTPQTSIETGVAAFVAWYKKFAALNADMV
jgi:UDP-glucuronate 4-epimerase